MRKSFTLTANNYSKLLNLEIIVASDSFDNDRSYIVRFFKTNFLHLTGVFTSLTPEKFYEKCLDGTILEDDFDIERTPEQKGLIRLKMKHLPNIDSFFEGELLVQENFEKGSIKYMIATSDGRCTIGFVDAKYHVRPKTILDKNHLNKSKKIINVKPTFRKIHN